MNACATLCLASLAFATSAFGAEALTGKLTLHLDRPAKAISPNLWGIFYEDLNYAADGGLYAELIQNRSFEYSPLEQAEWNALSFWEVALEGEGKARLVVDAGRPLHPNNPTYGVFQIENPSGKAALRNAGFDGISVEADKLYDLTLFARQLYKGHRWTPDKPGEKPVGLIARLVGSDGALLAESPLPEAGSDWTKLEATLQPTRSDPKAQFELIGTEPGGVGLDVISLFPRDTFKGRKNGLRADIAQAIADLQPRFARFPGGCLVHGNGVSNFYDWKGTIGPLETRRAQPNLWGYHQTGGLGYFEYFQFCEDLGAIPVPVVAAAVSCQNSGHTAGEGQSCVPLDQLDHYIQDILDLIEWANGPADSEWGSKRAAAGRPEPFGLKYLGVGNEDKMTPEFEERFTLIHKAIKKAYPEIVVIGSSGPFPDGEDFEEGWRIANELGLEMVDEHYYRDPDWFWSNLKRYDAYDRSQAKVYLGEFAAHDTGRRRTLRAALAEAAYMTALERNGDLVVMASYAPLLGKIGRTQWNPDLIYFDNEQVYPTISYEVQRLFGRSRGDEYLQADYPEFDQRFAASAVRDSSSGRVYLKLVNGGETAIDLSLALDSGAPLGGSATVTTLSGDLDDERGREKPVAALPRSEQVPISASELPLNLPPYSFVVVEFGE